MEILAFEGFISGTIGVKETLLHTSGHMRLVLAGLSN
jgi:hypothetical protein